MDLRWKDYLGKKGGGGGSRAWVGSILFYFNSIYFILVQFILFFCIIVYDRTEQ
jgi:hypothetical protein